jgi:hypothetical protein
MTAADKIAAPADGIDPRVRKVAAVVLGRTASAPDELEIEPHGERVVDHRHVLKAE